MKNVAKQSIGMGLLAGVALLQTAWAAPVGMIADMKGAPQVKVGSAWTRLRLLQRLEPGQVVKAPAGSEASIVVFANGQRYKVAAGQQATVTENGINGGQRLAALGGASARVAQRLGGSRTGAVRGRPPEAANPLSAQFKGWMLEGERTFQWDAIGRWDAASNQQVNAPLYSFTLFDQYDTPLWTTRTAELQATYPADLPPLQATNLGGTRRVYTYRLIPLDEKGAPILSLLSKWGVVTFLRQADADALMAEEQEFQPQYEANKDDPITLALRAELYRRYDVLQKVLETFQGGQFEPEAFQPTVNEILQQVGRFASALATPVQTEK
jgi:hypothetical protein